MLSFLDSCITAAGINLTDTDMDNLLSPYAKKQTGNLSILWIDQFLSQLSNTEKGNKCWTSPPFHHGRFMAIDPPGHRGLQKYWTIYI